MTLCEYRRIADLQRRLSKAQDDGNFGTKRRLEKALRSERHATLKQEVKRGKR